MLNVKELRIGNLIEYKITDKFDERKEWWEVSEIDADDIHWLSKVDNYDEDFRGIDLDDEWLEKLGFKSNGTCYEKNGMSMLFYDGWNLEYDKGRNDATMLWFGDVHQFQNLYFCLTGEELVISNSVS